MSYTQTVSHVTASQKAAGGEKAASTLNQINANSQYTNFGRKPIAAPKPVAAKSLATKATELASLQTEWNELCNLFGWKGTGGKRARRRRTRTRQRRHRTTKIKRRRPKHRGRPRRTRRK
jgi:hypothetical protein